ncbi:guanyl-nucleotide exchange factor sec2 [Gigaspora margarita]|uniref:Guanyl-nucleotide exchange factor sec2 n=1 Tax=Gigaspora margarita TaxID=4874 RepID=A0A8H3WWL8_GIGMA|nr:guanyl-nucleotide exchange factor sec2 [Gigaspora margarita]
MSGTDVIDELYEVNGQENSQMDAIDAMNTMDAIDSMDDMDDMDAMNDMNDMDAMDATSFLPLMLQAQDLVSKLESRVVELENDLENINEMHEQERNQLLQELGEKDEYIHDLKTKNSRLEYGARETILILVRAVEIIKAQNLKDDDKDDDVNKDDDDDNATAVESTDLEGQFLDSINLCLNYLKSAQNNLNNRKFTKNSSLSVTLRNDSTLLSSPNNDSNYKVGFVIPQLIPVLNNVVKNINNNDDLTNDICVNNNRLVHHDNSRRDSICGSQISLDDIPDLDEYDLDGSEDIADFDALFSDDDDNDEDINNDTDDLTSVDNDHNNNNDNDNDDLTSIDNSLTDDEYIKPDDHLSNFENHEITEEPEEIDYDDDDLISNDILRPSSSVSKSDNFCSSCNTLLAQVDQHIEERAYLKRDLSALAISLAEEKALCVKIQSNKESLEQEIDDWINGMFVKINQMVFDEATTCEELESLNRETKGKLNNILKSSGNRQDRLREMKSLLVHLDSIKQRQAVPSLNTSLLNRNSVLHRSLSNSLVNNQRFTKSFDHLFSTKNPFDNIMLFKEKRLYIDGIIFEEFQDYVKSFVNSVPPTSSTPTHPFMKRCMNEDIHPCLFEGSAGWKSPFYKRRLLDAIMKNQCEIQMIYSSFSSSVSTSSSVTQVNSPIDTQSNYDDPSPAPKLKCGLCGHLRSCDFHMKISDSDITVPPSTTTSSSRFSFTGNPGWIPLDRFCRDRVVAVCDFYAFLSHLRQGLFSNSPVWGMYKQCLKYRRKMCMARIGSVSMFEEEDSIINNYLSHSEMEGMVVVVH